MLYLVEIQIYYLTMVIVFLDFFRIFFVFSIILRGGGCLEVVVDFWFYTFLRGFFVLWVGMRNTGYFLVQDFL